MSGTLLLVGFSDERHPELIARAAQVAAALRLRIYAYFPVVDSRFAAVVSGDPAPISDALEDRLKRSDDELQNTLETLAALGHEVDGRVEWRRSPVSAVLNLVRDLAPRLVMLAPKRHDRVTEIFLSDDDFELIRLCRVPVWLVRRFPEQHRAILAAVDPTHDGDREFAVDNAVLSESRALASHLGKSLIAIHAVSSPTGMARAAEWSTHVALPVEHERVIAHRRQQLRELARLHGIPDKDLRVIEGHLVDVVRSSLEPLDADLVVIGALSRTRVRRMFVGGTAEELLRSVDADVLVVKE